MLRYLRVYQLLPFLNEGTKQLKSPNMTKSRVFSYTNQTRIVRRLWDLGTQGNQVIRTFPDRTKKMLFLVWRIFQVSAHPLLAQTQPFALIQAPRKSCCILPLTFFISTPCYEALSALPFSIKITFCCYLHLPPCCKFWSLSSYLYSATVLWSFFYWCNSAHAVFVAIPFA